MAIFDLKIELLMKNYVFRHLGMSGILKFDENLKNICFRNSKTNKTSKTLFLFSFRFVFVGLGGPCGGFGAPGGGFFSAGSSSALGYFYLR